MTSPKSIRLGGLTLIGSPTGNGEVIATMTAKDGATTLFLTPAEWSSLVRVAEVVEKAREWKRAADDPEAPVWKFTEKLDAAIDALDASEDKP